MIVFLRNKSRLKRYILDYKGKRKDSLEKVASAPESWIGNKIDLYWNLNLLTVSEYFVCFFCCYSHYL